MSGFEKVAERLNELRQAKETNLSCFAIEKCHKPPHTTTEQSIYTMYVDKTFLNEIDISNSEVSFETEGFSTTSS
jgi:hypothetical protein